MSFVFVKLVLATMGGACLAASLFTWKDASSRVQGPFWWTLGYALFTLVALSLLFPTDPWGEFLQLTGLYFAVIFQFYGFLRYDRMVGRWPLVPALGLALVIAAVTSLGFANDPQVRHALACSFFPLVLVLALFLPRPWVLWPRYTAVLALLGGLGTLGFFQSLWWSPAWYWVLVGHGDALALLVIVDVAALAFYQLRMVNRGYVMQLGGLDRDLAQSQREILVTLAEVIESSSHETAGHVVRVGTYATFLARALEKPEAEARLLGEAAHLHDIGKIGIPDRILDLQGPLDRSDAQVMQTHTLVGHAILSRSDRPLFRLAARIALEHHENWDGTGYPRGLRGTAISLEGRIVALCDVFDALSQRRSYKEPWPLSDIFDHIKEQRGLKFDPELVDLWLAHRTTLEEMAQGELEDEAEA